MSKSHLSLPDEAVVAKIFEHGFLCVTQAFCGIFLWTGPDAINFYASVTQLRMK